MVSNLLSSCCILLLLGFANCAVLPDGRIVGGEVASIEAFPYQVSLHIEGEHGCGGSILNSRVVLTAAHCVLERVNLDQFAIQYGVNSTTSSRNLIRVDRFVVHPLYDNSAEDYDVAIAFLSEDIPFSSVAQPIPLAVANPVAGTKAFVSGWGTTEEDGEPSYSTLMAVEVEIVPQNKCAADYRGSRGITDRMLCAGVDGGGKDACQLDSGGPLAADGILVGIVSWGNGCGRPEFPGVYTSVANVRPWIDETLRN